MYQFQTADYRHIKAAYLSPILQTLAMVWFFPRPILLITSTDHNSFLFGIVHHPSIVCCWLKQCLNFSIYNFLKILLWFSFCISSLHQISFLAPGNAILYKPVKLPLLNTWSARLLLRLQSKWPQIWSLFLNPASWIFGNSQNFKSNRKGGMCICSSVCLQP